jgi:hypothetical protein
MVDSTVGFSVPLVIFCTESCCCPMEAFKSTTSDGGDSVAEIVLFNEFILLMISTRFCLSGIGVMLGTLPALLVPVITENKISTGLIRLVNECIEFSMILPCKRAITVIRLTISCVLFPAFSWFPGRSNCDATSVGWVFLLRRLWPASLRLQLLLPSSNSASG